MRDIRHMTIAAVAAVGLTLAGCGGGGSSSTSEAPVVEPMPTAYETAKMTIMSAETAEAAQAAYDAVKDEVTAAEGDKLQMAVDDRVAALNMMARADDQKTALMTAAGMIDTSDLSTQEAVDAARNAIAGLRGALANADDVSDADKAMYMSTLDDAVTAVDDAQGGIDTDARRTNQMAALSGASDTLRDALAALSGSTPTQAQLTAARNALTALNTAISEGGDLTDAEKAPYVLVASNAAAPIQVAQMAFDDAEKEGENNRNTAMAATAAKLYAGISAPMGDTTSPAATDRAAAYDADGNILVSIGNGTDVPTPVDLSEDKKTTVSDHQGWTGQRFTAEPADDGTYEAVVYSKVPDPTEGAKFNDADNGGYTLDPTSGETGSLDTSGEAEQMKISSARFDQDAGVKEFEQGSNDRRVIVAGSYHGVSGNYYCTAAPSSTCAVRLVADGFALGGTADDTNAFTATGGTWTFKPTNPQARVTSTPNNVYASYGWWLHTSENGNTLTASAFAADRGAVDAANGIGALRGSATYTGGAAGKYALSSSTGGTNDAGHFTARATLEADFNTDMVTGTINEFMGVGGAKDWSVELMKSAIGDTGFIRAATDAAVTETDPGAKTKWTIGDTAATASGAWSGALKDNGDDGVPSIATGTFYSTYGQDGKMVGGFGVTKQ